MHRVFRAFFIRITSWSPAPLLEGSWDVPPLLKNTYRRILPTKHGLSPLVDVEGVSNNACTRKTEVLCLTQLASGLLQLVDLVLQEEHGHCEGQQRQELKLRCHHDP